MTLCPIAIVSGCRNCPALGICPLKSVIGDYKAPEETRQKADHRKIGGNRKK